MYISKWKKSVWKGYTLSDSNYMTFRKGKNNEEIKRISGCQGLGRRKGGMNRQSTEAFYDRENILWWIHAIIHLSKPKSEP